MASLISFAKGGGFPSPIVVMAGSGFSSGAGVGVGESGRSADVEEELSDFCDMDSARYVCFYDVSHIGSVL